MRIRWKLLILLLLIAIAPLCVMSWLATRVTRELGDDLSSRAGKSLESMARHQMLQVVDEQCRLLRHNADLIEFALRVQAREMSRCLALGGRGGGDLLIVGEGPVAADAAADLIDSPRHARIGGTSPEPMRVSYARPAAWLAPGASLRTSLTEEASRLLCGDLHTFLNDSEPVRLLWRHTTLENGVHARYPGTDRFPAAYDPRQEEWYRGAVRGSAGVQWFAPTVDRVTNQLVLTCAAPIRDANGSVAGVTAVDIAVGDLMRQVRMPATWATSAECLIVMPAGVIEQSATQPVSSAVLFMIARRSAIASDDRPSNQYQPLTVRSSDADEFEQMLRNMSQQQAGVRQMEFGGQTCLWGYAPILREGSYLLVIVPKSTTAAAVEFAETYIMQRAQQQVLQAGLIVGLLMALVAAVAMLVARSITRPIATVIDVARRVASGDLEARAEVRSRDELGDLGRTINLMVPQLRDSLRLRESMALAEQVQQSLLPTRSPRVPGFELAGRSLYCDQTGGDYFDFVELQPADDGSPRIGIAVADVTGHGVAAALLMTTVRALLRSRSENVTDLGSLLSTVNRHLIVGAPDDRFVTLYFLVLEAAARRVRWSSAGHDAAISYFPARDELRELAGNDLPLAVDDGWKYAESGTMTLEPGQIVLIGTDGIWETRNARREQYGKERLHRVLRARHECCANDIMEAVLADVAAFRGDLPQHDDVTIVVLKYVG